MVAHSTHLRLPCPRDDGPDVQSAWSVGNSSSHSSNSGETSARCRPAQALRAVRRFDLLGDGKRVVDSRPRYGLPGGCRIAGVRSLARVGVCGVPRMHHVRLADSMGRRARSSVRTMQQPESRICRQLVTNVPRRHRFRGPSVGVPCRNEWSSSGVVLQERS